MNWIKIKDKLPKEDVRVLVFTPGYQEGDPMRYRVMDSRFVKICSEVTHWTYLEAPEESA